jgi:hypothetical protein
LSLREDLRLLTVRAGRLRVENGRSNALHFGRYVGISHHDGGETVPQGIASDTRLGERSTGTRTALRIAPVGGNLCLRCHGVSISLATIIMLP